MCITTSTDKAIADEILTRLGIRDYFTYIVTCEESGGDKEGPEVFINAHNMLGTPKEETVVFRRWYTRHQRGKRSRFLRYRRLR